MPTTDARRPSGNAPWPQVAVALVACVVGVACRFALLDRKLYWNDEVWTSIWISGHTVGEMERELASQGPLTAEELLRFQRTTPGLGIGRTVAALAWDDPKFPPLYFALARVWAGAVGDSPARIRALSAVCGTLVIAAFAALCLELFGRRAAWIGAALMAVSPFHAVYAQEARPYSLLTLLTLLAGVTLLRALPRPTAVRWSIYGITVALGLYTHALFIVVVAGHAAFVAWRTRSREPGSLGWPPRLPSAFVVTVLLAAASLLPWVVAGLSRLVEMRGNIGWVFRHAGYREVLERWFFALTYPFADLLPPAAPGVGREPWATAAVAVSAVALLLAAYALHLVARRGSESARAFLVTTVAPAAAVLMLPDLLLGGRALSQPRYLIPVLLGLQLAVVHLLATVSAAGSRAHRRAWTGIALLLVAVGALSCLAGVRSEVCWNKYQPIDIVRAAKLVHAAPRPLVLGAASGLELRRVLSLAHRLDDGAGVLLLDGAIERSRLADFDEILWFNPEPSAVAAAAESGLRFRPFDARADLWRLTLAPRPPNE